MGPTSRSWWPHHSPGSRAGGTPCPSTPTVRRGSMAERLATLTAPTGPESAGDGGAIPSSTALGRLGELRARIRRGQSPHATQTQHDKGKLTAYERIDLLLDPDSFAEVEPLRRHRATGF